MVTEFDKSKRLKDIEFSYIPVWVRVFDLPLGLMDSTNGLLLGNQIGRALEIVTEEYSSSGFSEDKSEN